MPAHAVDAPPDPQPTSTIAFAVWIALLGASIEVLALFLQKRADPLMHLNRDFVWMAPLALVSVTLMAVAPFVLLGRVRHSRLMASLALFLASFIVYLNLLMLVPRLLHYAAALLAAGLAIQTTRALGRRQSGAGRLIRRSTVWLLAYSVAAGVLMGMSLRPAGGSPPSSATVAARRPNVVFVTLDTVRAANLSLYGYGRRTSPHLEQFAKRGVVFERAFSTAPWTLSSHGSMFTGRWPHELSAGFDTPLDGEHAVLAEYLAVRGYATVGFAANLKYCSAESGLGRGFQHYEDHPRTIGGIASTSTVIRTVANNFRLRRVIQNDQHLDRVTAESLTTRATTWISAHAGRPFFMFLNYMDAHEPYLPPAPYDRQFGPGRPFGRHSPLHHWLWNVAVAHGNMGDRERQEELDAYDGALAYLDDHLGRLFEALEGRGVLDNTIVVITSDHGEEFGEHGLYDHGYSLYQTGLHVPLVVVAPGRVPAGRRVSAPVSLRDLAATVEALTGLTETRAFPGTSLAPLWAGSPEPPHVSPVFFEVERSPGQPDWFPSSRGPMRGVVHQGLHYIRNGDGTEELYDLERDPWERQNLVSIPERGAALAEARALLARVQSNSDASRVP